MGPMFQDEGSSSVTSSPLQNFSMMSLPSGLGTPYTWLRELKSEERGLYLIHLLLACGNYVAAGNFGNANIALEQISQLAAPDGDTMQRIAAYFAEALADRVLKSWSGLHKALNASKITFVSEQALIRRVFLEYFPILKVAYLVTNQAIIETMEGEKMVHIIDLNAAEPAQWVALINAFRARQEGPPHLRITGVHPKKEVLDQMAQKLSEEAEKLDIPFQFNPVVSTIESLDMEKLRVKTGEALAISSVLQLHTLLATDDDQHLKKSHMGTITGNGIHMPRVHQKGEVLEKDVVNGCSPSSDSAASSPQLSTTTAKVDSSINALWSLSPKLMVVAEQDSNHNGASFMERLLEALHSYAALFDCLESTFSRTSLERLKLEKMLFGEEIKNIVACEGFERKERHEKLEKWAQRLELAGFRNVPLSYYAIMQASRLLQGYNCDGYKIKEDNGCLRLCWQDRSLFSVSAWRSRK